MGADAKLAASTVSRMIVTAETIQHLVDSAKASNKSMDYVRDNVLEMFSLIEDAHYTILDEVLRYLPYLMAQSSATYTALLLFLVLASAPFLFGVSVFLLCVGMANSIFFCFKISLNSLKFQKKTKSF